MLLWQIRLIIVYYNVIDVRKSDVGVFERFEEVNDYTAWLKYYARSFSQFEGHFRNAFKNIVWQ